MAESVKRSGWNQPIPNGDHSSKSSGRSVRHPSNWLVIVTGMCVIALAGALWLFVGRGTVESEQPESEKDSRLIKEFTPANVKTDSQKVEEAQPQPTNLVKCWDGRMVEWPPKGAYKDEQGVWRHPGGQMCFDPRAKPSFIGTKSRQIFDHVSEEQVANLLTARPGTMFFGTTMPMFKSKKFKEDFVAAILSPTEINEEDSEADKALKNDVRETMKDLAERVKAGEDLGEILSSARAELQRLGQYKQDLVKELKDAMKGQELSDDDVRTYIEAANAMLEKKGIAPMSVSDLAVRNLRRNVERMSAIEAQKSEGGEK